MVSSSDGHVEQEHGDRQDYAQGRQGLSRMQKIALGTAASLLGLSLLGLLAVVLWLHFNKLPDIRMLENFAPVQAIKIFDRYDKLVVAISSNEDRRPVKLSQVSPSMRLAMIGAEDHEFYHHGGINPSSILRAMIVNLQAGRIVEGGSTITQQLVKNLFFPGERRTFNRKIKEFFLANQADRKYSKDRILEMYLNQIYFGNQSYGIESAAQRYFWKPASKLTLGESAFLAGLVRSPSYLSNPAHRAQAFARQHQVLDEMVAYGMITKPQAEAAKEEQLKFRKFVDPYQKYPFYLSYVMDELREHYGGQELQHGLNVYTCLDPQAQVAAEKVINDGIAHAPAGVKQGALVSLHVADAGVIAMVGGAGGFEEHQWNRAVSPHTMGSSFKPFVYLTGFMKGLTPDSTVLDEPFSAPSGGRIYSPHNFDNRFFGPMSIKMALTQSRNVCAVRIACFCGIQNVIKTARLAGITSKLDPYLPTSVGACAASPLEMAGAYSTFARGGIYLTPHLVRRIDSPDGKTIYRYDEKPRKVFDSGPVSELIECMQNVVQHGTGIYAQLPNRPVAGKTGTADKSRDIWFIGFTPDTCTACWGGNDHNRAVNNKAVTGGMVMAGMWKKYMLAYYDLHPTAPGEFMVASKEQVKVAAADANSPDKSNGANGQSAADSKNAQPNSTAANGDQQQSANNNDQQQTANGDQSATSADNSSSNQVPGPSSLRRSKKLIARKADDSKKQDGKNPAANHSDESTAPPAEAAAAPGDTQETPSEAELPAKESPKAEQKAAAPEPAAPPRPRVPAARPPMLLMRTPDGRLFLVPVRRPATPAPMPVPVAPAVPQVVAPPAAVAAPVSSPMPTETDDE